MLAKRVDVRQRLLIWSALFAMTLGLVAYSPASALATGSGDLYSGDPVVNEHDLTSTDAILKNNACGTASATMMLDYYLLRANPSQAPESIDAVRAYVPVTHVGTTGLDMQNGISEASAAPALEVNKPLTTAWRQTTAGQWQSAVEAELNAKLPIIAFIPDGGALGWSWHYGHYIFVTGYTGDGSIIYYDPWDGARHQETATDFAAAWGTRWRQNAPWLFLEALPPGTDSPLSTNTATNPATPNIPTPTPTQVTPYVLYVASENGMLNALDSSTGQPLWSVDIGASSSDAAGPIINAVSRQGILFLTSRQSDPNNPEVGHVYAIDLQTHTVLWVTHLTVGYLGQQGGIVYVSDATGIAALNSHTDQRYWHYDTAQAYSTSFDIADGVIYLGFAQDGAQAYLDAIRATDGTRLWRRTLRGTYPSSVAVSNGKVYVGSHGANAFSLLVETFDVATGAPGWVTQDSGTNLDITVSGNDVFAHTVGSDPSGSVMVLNANTGAQVFGIGQSDACYIDSPHLFGGVGYIGCSSLVDGNSSVLAFNAQTGATLWQQKAPGTYVSVITQDGDVVYVDDSSNNGEGTSALSATTGSILWHHSGSLMTATGGVAYMTDQGQLIAYNAPSGAALWHNNIVGEYPSALAA